MLLDFRPYHCFFFVVFLTFILAIPSAAQFELWGVRSDNGEYGSFYRANPRTGQYVNEFEFPAVISGKKPSYSALVEAPNGMLYGLTSSGGTYNGGVIFEWNPITNVYNKRFDFSSSTGLSPLGSLVYQDGKFYGIAISGGANDLGTIFEWDPVSNIFIKKIDLTMAGGRFPYSAMTFANGKFYGAMTFGGANGTGTLFEWDPVTNTYTKKIDFATSSGAYPKSALSYYQGKFYGNTTAGGTNDKGVIFEWDPVSNTYTKKIDLSTTNGSMPIGGLKLFNGKFYGMTTEGGTGGSGLIFEWDPTSNVYVRKIILSSSLGQQPYGEMILSNGIFYGMTSAGGAAGVGVIFAWNPASNVFSKKIDFNGKNGGEPQGSLTLKQGKFFGMTSYGGTYNSGVIFQWDPSTNYFTKSLDFGESKGYLAIKPPVFYNGKFYGLTELGGKNNQGVLYEWDPGAKTYTVKLDFNAQTGYSPIGSLHLYNGKFYGTTGAGGLNDAGVLFEWDPISDTYLKKFDFDFTVGSGPGDLYWLNGKFYGLTSWGGANGSGVFYEYDPSTQVYKKKFDFKGIYGNDGHSGWLTLGPDDKFYGMAIYGGDYDNGYFFELDPLTGKQQIYFSLNTDFPNSVGAPLVYEGHELYGVTNSFSNRNQGMFYRVAGFSGIEKISDVQTFLNDCCTSGYMTAYKGNFYGISSSAIFKKAPVDAYASKIVNLPFNPGGPAGDFLILPSTIFFNQIPTAHYGDAPLTLRAYASSGLPIRFTSSDDSIAKIAGDQLEIRGSGTVSITAEESADPAQRFALPVTISFTVDKAPLNATVSNAQRIYGEANPKFDLILTGFVNGEDTAMLDSLPTITTVASDSSSVGKYTIFLSGGRDKNYDFIRKNGTLNIVKALLQVSTVDRSKIYGEANPAFDVVYQGFVNSEDVSVIDMKPIASSLATNTSGTGSYNITIDGGLDNNYDFVRHNGKLTIAKAILQVSAINANRNYGDNDPKFNVDYQGFVNGDDASVIDTLPTAATTATDISAVGIYPIIVSGGMDDNYDFIRYDGVLTINKVVLRVSTVDNSREYGDSNPPLGVNYEGFANDEDISVIDTRPIASTIATNTSDVGVYSISIDGGMDSNYEFEYTFGNLTITKAPLTVLAMHKEKIYLEPIPELTYMLTGLKNGGDDNEIQIEPLMTDATPESDVGEYAIRFTGAKSVNYALTMVEDSLTILKAKASISLTMLNQLEDGSPKIPVISTVPEGLDVALIFNGTDTPPVLPGTYSVIATIANRNYEGETSAVFVIAQVTGIENNSSSMINVYPNPVSELLIIKDDAVMAGLHNELLIIDVSGKLMFKGTMGSDACIDVKSFPSGVYMIKINRNDQVRFIRFMVSR